MLLQIMEIETPLNHCINAALAGGKASLLTSSDEVVIKESFVGEGHAIVTDADIASNKAILTILQSDFDSYFITEEETTISEISNRILNESSFDKLEECRAYVIDEICGTSSHKIGHYEWAVSVGYVDRLEHSAGAIYAPKVYGGALFYAAKDKGAFMQIGEKNKLGGVERVDSEDSGDEKLSVSDTELKDAYVIFGADCVIKSKYPKHFELMGQISDDIRTTNMNGSCALPLALVAAGKVDALVQPLQCVWDYAAGKVLVEEAGGIIKFYEMDEKGNCFPIDELQLKHYDPGKRKVGFIAGNKNIVDELMAKLKALND